MSKRRPVQEALNELQEATDVLDVMRLQGEIVTTVEILKDQRDALREKLRALTEYCTSGERYKTQNPYTVPAIKQASHLLERLEKS